MRKAFSILALAVLCICFTSCTSAPAPETITREQLLEEPVDYRDTLEKLLRTPVDPRDPVSGRDYAVLRKECRFAYSQEPIYALELVKIDIPFCDFIRSWKFTSQLDQPLKWAYRKPKPLEFNEPQLFRCSKEEFDSVEVGDLLWIEGAKHREYKVGVIIELKKNYGPMIYDPDGLIYYLYHKPAE